APSPPPGSPRAGAAARPSRPPRSGRTIHPPGPPGWGTENRRRVGEFHSCRAPLAPEGADHLGLALDGAGDAAQVRGDLGVGGPLRLPACPPRGGLQLVAGQSDELVEVALPELWGGFGFTGLELADPMRDRPWGRHRPRASTGTMVR